MKKLFVLILSLLVFCSFNFLSAQQSQKELKKEKKQQQKELKAKDSKLEDKITEKAPRLARKAAKRLKKEGWIEPAGELPIDKQLEEAWKRQLEQDDQGYKKYVIGNAYATGNNYSAAKDQALSLAKIDLVKKIESQIAGLTENSVANQDLSQQEAASISKTVSASKELIAQKLGRVQQITNVYRELKNKNIQVQVTIAYSTDLAMQSTRNEIIKKLESETQIAHDKLEKMMGMDKLKKIKDNSSIKEEE